MITISDRIVAFLDASLAASVDEIADALKMSPRCLAAHLSRCKKAGRIRAVQRGIYVSEGVAAGAAAVRESRIDSRARMGWVDCSSELPPLGIKVLAFRADCGVFIARRDTVRAGYSEGFVDNLLEKGLVSSSYLDEILWFDDDYIYDVRLTPEFWMALPALPASS